MNQPVDTFDPLFLGQNEGFSQYQTMMNQSIETLLNHASRQTYSGKSRHDVHQDINRSMDFSTNASWQDVLDETFNNVLNHTINVSHPKCVAHLHCPPLIPALAAEVLISALNQSMDSWDQSGAATNLEVSMIQWLCHQFGYDQQPDGAFTSGGTQSNYTGLLLARNLYVQSHFGINGHEEGLPYEAHTLRILCSEHAHFTIKQAAAQLGLGENAVIPIPTDDANRMDIGEALNTLQYLRQNNLNPFAIVATAGTTDFGSIDPLQDLHDMAQAYDIWLHVDAAYGGGVMLSDQYNDVLTGIEQADSIAVDFHKWFYQPISCGAFLLRDRHLFKYMKHHAEYLNPEEDELDGILNLAGKSTQTTRRFDALKLFMTLKFIGTEKLTDMIETTISTARQTAELIDNDSNLELAHFPELNAVVFRFMPNEMDHINMINRQIQQLLLIQGQAVIAKTKIRGDTYLKLTLLNPMTSLSDIQDILSDIIAEGQAQSIHINQEVVG
ncbi:pyridoxal phosphate-dependent decarboxylase family protein [Tuberibacillus sp. Marseille-P3662]|uniref:pyridoxal phosphate-dependent decarboxylase family protein n=1 Tax=Tuberibacillus sp. Marseille-P3662 TaxID=1965358 RepID=UPI000A1C892C|nr:aspartate aminotransferase family protein [Tuberibacillus sp. Marseille-P3662]